MSLLFKSEAEIAADLNRLKTLNVDWPTVDVLEVNGGISSWYRSLDDEAFKAFCANLSQAEKRFFFLRSCLASEDKSSFVNPVAVEILNGCTSISQTLLSRISSDLENQSVFAEVTSLFKDENGSIASFSFLYNILVSHGSRSVSLYTEICSRPGELTYVYVNYPENLVTNSFDFSLVVEASLADVHLFDWHLHLISCQLSNIGRKVDTKERTLEVDDFEDETTTLHNLSTELETLMYSLRFHQILIQKLQECEAWILSYNDSPSLPRHGQLRLLLSMIKYHLLFGDGTQRRIQVQLNLLLHRANLAEARANQAIAKQSAELTAQSKDLAAQSRDLGAWTAVLARQTSADSASMITIAAVTMLFLPATFISSLFSTGFFHFDGGKLSTSEVVWIYPAIVIPLTAVVFAIWLAWIKLRPNKLKELDDKIKILKLE